MDVANLQERADPRREPALSPLPEPITLLRLTVRNRMVGTAHNSRYGEGGLTTERYQLYSEKKTKGHPADRRRGREPRHSRRDLRGGAAMSRPVTSAAPSRRPAAARSA